MKLQETGLHRLTVNTIKKIKWPSDHNQEAVVQEAYSSFLFACIGDRLLLKDDFESAIL
jgi:hypothetical protein